jgi:hypothetical protein
MGVLIDLLFVGEVKGADAVGGGGGMFVGVLLCSG